MNTFKWLAAIILLALGAIAVFQNMETVSVKFLIYTFSTSRALLILGAILVGVILGMLYANTLLKRKEQKKK
jgi:uncharacterized integral membrane protein